MPPQEMSSTGHEPDLNFPLYLSLQREELVVLESIYPDRVSSDGSSRTLKLEIPIELTALTAVEIIEIDNGTSYKPSSNTPGITDIGINSNPDSTSSRHLLSLSTLPPIVLNIYLPQDYPLSSPPVIVSLSVTHSWLPTQLEVLQRTLMDMWQPGDTVLYDWIEFIRSAEFLESMGLTTPSRDIIQLSHSCPRSLITLLYHHETKMKAKQFSETTYACSVCLTTYRGTLCVQLSTCTHVFCRACLDSFWTNCIVEGDVGRVGCPDPGCVKGGSEAAEEDVVRVIGTGELIKRWKWLKEKRELERDPTIVYCPLPLCQTAIPKPETEEDAESGWTRLRTCGTCAYSFCTFCRRAWHGPISDCASLPQSFILRYISLSEDSPFRRDMEQNYGKGRLVKLVERYKQEREKLRLRSVKEKEDAMRQRAVEAKKSEEWIDTETMGCPNCHVRIQRSYGCNHMSCSRCRVDFCYDCGRRMEAPFFDHTCPGRLEYGYGND